MGFQRPRCVCAGQGGVPAPLLKYEQDLHDPVVISPFHSPLHLEQGFDINPPPAIESRLKKPKGFPMFLTWNRDFLVGRWK